MELALKSRKEYEDLLASAQKIAELYGTICLGDFFDLAGLKYDMYVYNGSKTGWDRGMLNSVYGRASSYDSYYFMVLPDPKPLDELKKEPTQTDMVNHPPHYQSNGGIEVIDVIKAFTADLNGMEAYDTGNVIKYICRWKHKNGIEDLKKAAWYINDLINILEEESNK